MPKILMSRIEYDTRVQMSKLTFQTVSGHFSSDPSPLHSALLDYTLAELRAYQSFKADLDGVTFEVNLPDRPKALIDATAALSAPQ